MTTETTQTEAKTEQDFDEKAAIRDCVEYGVGVTCIAADSAEGVQDRLAPLHPEGSDFTISIAAMGAFYASQLEHCAERLAESATDGSPVQSRMKLTAISSAIAAGAFTGAMQSLWSQRAKEGRPMPKLTEELRAEAARMQAKAEAELKESKAEN